MQFDAIVESLGGTSAVFEFIKSNGYSIIIGGFILIVAALFGGRPVELQSLKFGPIGRIPRIVAGLLSVVTLAISIISIIYTPYVEIVGTYIPSGAGRRVDEDLKVSLLKVESPINTDSGNFEFIKSQKIRKGAYTLLLFKNERLISNQRINISRQNSIILTQIGNSVSLDTGNIFQHLIDLYNRLGPWQQRVQAVQRLGGLARSSDTYKNKLVEMLESENANLALVAVYSLGEICDVRVVPYLQRIMNDNDKNKFDRMRSSSYLLCFRDTQEARNARQYLESVFNQDGYDDRHYRTAALILAKSSIRNSCVYKYLINGLTEGAQSLREDRKQELISLVGNVEQPSSSSMWRRWYDDYASRNGPCA